jgi:hypothetical protein
VFLRAKMPCCFGLLILILLPLGADSQVPVATPVNSAAQRLPAYSATLWTTITYPLPGGSTRSVTQRTEVSRDALGQWQNAYYRPTSGPHYDASAPLEHTVSGITTSAGKTLAPSISSGETLEQDEDLGTRIESGLQTQGRRRTFLSVGRQPATNHILETWYSPVLGTVVHSVSHNFEGSVIVCDLTNLQVGSSSASPTQIRSSSEGAGTAQQTPSHLNLYHALFSIVAHMERARLADSSSQVGDMAFAEDSLRSKIALSKGEWQSLLTAAVKVDTYTEQIDKQARAFASQARAVGSKGLNPEGTLAATKAGLHKMQIDQDDRILKDIQELESNVSTDGVAKIHAYLHGPLAASAHVTLLKSHTGGAQ